MSISTRTLSCAALAAACLLAPGTADAGWRARAEELEAQAQLEQLERAAETQQAAGGSAAAWRAQKPFGSADLVAAVMMEEGLAVEGRPALILSREQLASAVETGSLDGAQVRWLKPKASVLPPNPHATTDFTAYTLQPGELKVGLLSVAAGVLPNVQLSTMPIIYYAGLPNISAKVNAIQVGPLNLAVTADRYWLRQETFRSSYTGVGGVASLRILPAWSLHGGFSYAGLAAKGAPDLCALSPLLTDACVEIIDEPDALEGSGSAFSLAGNDIYGEVMWVRAATDIRFNRRDSFIIQAAAVPFARLQVDSDMELPDIAKLDEVLAFDGRVPLSSMYVVSGA